MAKQLLIETRMNSLSLLEGVQSKNPNCLGTLYGPCADYKNPTRNDNFYSRKLWENVFKDPLVKESLEDRVLIGELDHPGDRLETKATNACIVMTGYDFDDDAGVVNGRFDILNTPNGKILRSLLDYGCKIGVSSRGEGDVTDNAEGKHVVDEDGTYYFVAFDAVVLPAVKKAKPALQESLKRQTLKDSLVEQISSSTTKAELDLIKKVVEATELPDSDSLLESINNKSNELEGSNDSSNLMEDLERANLQISQLTEENKSLNEEVANCKSRLKKAFESKLSMKTDKNNLQEAFENLQAEHKTTVFEFIQASQELDGCKQNLKAASETIESLKENLRTNGSKTSELESRIKGLEEALEKSQNANSEKNTQLSELREQLNKQSSRIKKLTSDLKDTESKLSKMESASKVSSAKAAREKKQVLEAYALKRSKDLGVDSKRVLESLKSGSSFKDVDKLIDEEIDRTDRYRKLPVMNDSILSTLSQATVSIKTEGLHAKALSEEDEQSIEFMTGYYNQNK